MPNSFHIQNENEPFNRERKLLISTCSMTWIRNLSWYSASTRFSLWISRGATCLMPITYQHVVVESLRKITEKWKRNWMTKQNEGSLHSKTRESNSKSRAHYPPIWLIQLEWIAINHSWTKWTTWVINGSLNLLRSLYNSKKNCCQHSIHITKLM